MTITIVNLCSLVTCIAYLVIYPSFVQRDIDSVAMVSKDFGAGEDAPATGICHVHSIVGIVGYVGIRYIKVS